MDVRSGQLERATALKWVRHYDGTFPETYMDVPYTEVLNQIGMTECQFQNSMDEFTNWALFKQRDGNEELKLIGDEE